MDFRDRTIYDIFRLLTSLSETRTLYFFSFTFLFVDSNLNFKRKYSDTTAVSLVLSVLWGMWMGQISHYQCMNPSENMKCKTASFLDFFFFEILLKLIPSCLFLFYLFFFLLLLLCQFKYLRLDLVIFYGTQCFLVSFRFYLIFCQFFLVLVQWFSQFFNLLRYSSGLFISHVFFLDYGDF